MKSDEITFVFDEYIRSLKREYDTGNAKEHSYRPALKNLFEALEPSIIAVNEPARLSVGAPDFVIEREDQRNLRKAKLFASPPLALVEAKDLQVDLDDAENQKQLKRYLEMGNVLHTNYLEFRFYVNHQLLIKIVLAEIDQQRILVDSAQYSAFDLAFKQLLVAAPTIRTPKQLANLMAQRARAIREYIKTALVQDELNKSDTELRQQFHAFRSQLVHDLDELRFADLYAQTLAYGLFAARYYDESSQSFSIQEAAQTLPSTNPFLQKFFREIAGYEQEERINWVLDSLVDVFLHCNVRELMQEAGDEWTRQHDPLIHFYETFLDKYDPELRRKMGVYYTPIPVVRYIVRSVNKILKKEFSINEGLADTSKIEVNVKSHARTKADNLRGYAEGKRLIHRVQILDPALGTGTFLNEVIKLVHKQQKLKLGSGWSKYVELDLLPRMYGFELLMAPYTMAHLRLNLTFAETGFTPLSGRERLRVYLTNTLEEPHIEDDDLPNLLGFQKILATEAQEADIVKTTSPIMIVLGNPPYSAVSSNETSFANNLVAAYKREPGGNDKLKEKKHWLNDDYVKFLAFAEAMINKTGEGLVAMITNHGYLDNPTFRGMRWHLLKSFTKIFILDLHGSTKKKKKPLGGGPDENVFNIQQGVSIILAVKRLDASQSLADVYRADLLGRKQSKFEALEAESIEWKRIDPHLNSYSFTLPAQGDEKKYEEGIAINKLFPVYTSGVITMGDGFTIAGSEETLKIRLKQFLEEDITEKELSEQFHLGKNYAKWIISNKKILDFKSPKTAQILYRPFDTRWTYFDNKLVWRPRTKVMKNMLDGPNLSLISIRRSREAEGPWRQIFITDRLVAGATSVSSLDINYAFPLYLYINQTKLNGAKIRTPNLEPTMLKKLLSNIKPYKLVNHDYKKTINNSIITPGDIINYVYAVLHSGKYLETYKEYLKRDFPRIPLAKNRDQFWNLVNLGDMLCKLHLGKANNHNEKTYTPTGKGSWKTERIHYEEGLNKDGKVWINSTQYFANVPKIAWEFFIGGYQPAQKWLKDRKGQELNTDELIHYQKIISILLETDKLMKDIDKVWQP